MQRHVNLTPLQISELVKGLSHQDAVEFINEFEHDFPECEGENSMESIVQTQTEELLADTFADEEKDDLFPSMQRFPAAVVSAQRKILRYSLAGEIVATDTMPIELTLEDVIDKKHWYVCADTCEFVWDDSAIKLKGGQYFLNDKKVIPLRNFLQGKFTINGTEKTLTPKERREIKLINGKLYYRDDIVVRQLTIYSLHHHGHFFKVVNDREPDPNMFTIRKQL